jgi:enoyl-CoA hydratase/carnithine racemase
METISVLRDRRDDGTVVLRLDRPQARNAMDAATIAQLRGELAELGADPDVRVLVLSTTSERAFCAGADVAEPLDREAGVARMEAFARLYEVIDAFAAPTICVCVGNVVGAGAELAAGCDLRVGGDNLKLAWAGARLGVPIGPARLVPLIGMATAKDWVLTGRVIDMEEAAAARFLQRTAPAAQAEGVALELAAQLAAHPTQGLRQLKAMFRSYEDLPARIADENERIVEFQRSGTGLPQRR